MAELCLPESFAEKLFELEAALEYEATMENIRDLNDLYRAGIDYYIEKEHRKAMYLQKKMTNLLANPDNIRVLQRQSKKTANQLSLNEQKPQPQQRTTQAAHGPVLNTRKLKEQITKFHTVADTCIQSIVENSNKMADKIQKLKKKDLNKQEEQLNDRIMLKRVKSQEKINRLNFKNDKVVIPMVTGPAVESHVENSQPKSGLKSFIQ